MPHPHLKWFRRLAAGCVFAIGPLVQVAAQDHPRLLFGAADITGLRARLSAEPYQSIYQQLLANRDRQDDADAGGNYAQVRNGFLYVLTGDPFYAEASRAHVTEVIGRSTWALDSESALRRAMMGKGVALAYDFCFDAWPAAFREEVSLALDANAKSLMRNGGTGWPGDTAVANNWHGVRYSGALLCFLASDVTGNTAQINTAYTRLRTHLQAKYGTGPDASGWDLEGKGYVTYPWGSFLGATGIVLQRLLGIDMIADAPGAGYAIWAMYAGAVPLPTWNTALDRPGLGLAPDFSDDHPHIQGEGAHGLAFYYAPQGFRPGIRWLYDRFWGAQGDQTWDGARHGEVYSFLYYPGPQEPAENPIDVWGNYYLDERFGVVSFRNRYQDDHDLVTQMLGKHLYLANTHAGADINSLRIFGFGTIWTTGSGRTGQSGGQTTVFPSNPGTSNGLVAETGRLVGYYFGEGGSGHATIRGSSTRVNNHQRHLVTDYSGAAGAPGVWVVRDTSANGMLWRLNTPEFNSISTHPGGFTLTAPNGNTLRGTILHPAGVTPATGVFVRGNGIRFGANTYSNNKYVDVPGSDGSFLVVLTVQGAGRPAPAVTPVAGAGVDQRFTVGGATYAFSGGGLLVTGWTGGALAPLASLTRPAAGQYVRAGTNVLLEASALDLDGSVTEVRFLKDGTPLRTVTAPPYRHLLTSVPAGAHDVTVVAVDNAGNLSIPSTTRFQSVVPKEPYAGIPATSYDANQTFRAVGGGELGYLQSGGWTRYNAVDFGDRGPVRVRVDGRVINGGSCDFRLDSTTGPIIATVVFSGSGPFFANIAAGADATGIRDLFFTYRSGGPGIANVTQFTFEEAPPPPIVHLRFENGTHVLQFASVANYRYHVERSADLAPDSWNTIDSVEGTGELLTVPVTPTAGPRTFYRLRMERITPGGGP